MFIDHSKRIVFVHNPKTAGRSVAEFMSFDDSAPFRFAHAPAELIRNRIFQNDWSQFFSFCVVRNPWDRYVSLYYFQRSERYAALLKNNASSKIARKFELNDWIEFNVGSAVKSNWFGVEQSEWWRGVTEVYRYEKLPELFEDLRSRFGITRPSTHRNRNTEASHKSREELSTRSIEIIAGLERDTIEEFGYAPD